VALIIQAMQRFAQHLLHAWYSYALAVAAFITVYFFGIGFPWIVLIALGLGLCLRGRVSAMDSHRSAPAQRSANEPEAEPLAYYIDQGSAMPAHTQFRWGKLIMVLVIGLLLWLLPYAALQISFGADHRFSLMAIFFTKAALLSFGGAYAVLPYVHEGAVSQFAWVSAKDMMAGLALGESTPGPLVMVLVFVGFLAGYALKLDLASGVLAACLTAWFTFLPSFVFIFAGAPLVESTRTLPSLSVPLSFLGSALLGVMLSLALKFATQVLIPEGLSAPNWFGVLIFGLALLALLKLKISIPKVLLLCATLGWCVQRGLAG
jgi:chromate transporter